MTATTSASPKSAAAYLKDRRALAERRTVADGSWRLCEFCGCKTNAQERICCQPGRLADRSAWNRSASD